MPDSVDGVSDGQDFYAGPGRSIVRRSGAMVCGAGADGKDVQVGRHRARPGVRDGYLGGHRLVESGCRSREHHDQVMVVAHTWGTDILYADIGHGAADDKSEIPAHRARA